MGEYFYGWIWMMGKYDLCININFGWIWFMCKYELVVNNNYGWGDRQTQTHRQKDRHINAMTCSVLAELSEKY